MATTITIRHVPEDVRNELAARAASSGRSLQEFMLQEVTSIAAKPSREAWLAQVRANKQRNPHFIGPEQILADRDADRR